jgi:undecaprenyl diphosphate synthase
MFFVSLALRRVRFDTSSSRLGIGSIKSNNDGNSVGNADHAQYRTSNEFEAHHISNGLGRSKGAMMPEHVAFIVDGNGRWAEKQGLPRSRGHAEGANVTVEVVKRCFAEGVNTVTLYLFSTENWKRPVDEVRNIMYLLEKYLKDFRGHLQENDIALKVIGQTHRLPRNVLSLVDAFTEAATVGAAATAVGVVGGAYASAAPAATDRNRHIQRNIVAFNPEEAHTSIHADYSAHSSSSEPVASIATSTSTCTSTSSCEECTDKTKQKVLCLAISYGGRDDIVHAARRIAARVKCGDLSIDQITEEEFAKHTMTGAEGISDPDVIIRTSGEHRLSNFLLWQCAYSEFVSVDKLWPDFSAEEAVELLGQFAGRKRRYGGIQGGPQ